jgi:hypothetical protein
MKIVRAVRGLRGLLKARNWNYYEPNPYYDPDYDLDAGGSFESVYDPELADDCVTIRFEGVTPLEERGT